MAAKTKIILDRRKVMARILRDRGDALLVTGLGAPTWDAAAVGDHANNFYLWGGMGGAVMTGLGLALAQPGRRVLVITGDGEMMMGVGALATIGVAAPGNLAICVIDNEHYGETGMQEGHTGAGVDLAAMAAAKKLYLGATPAFPGSQESSVREFLRSGRCALQVLKPRQVEPDAVGPPEHVHSGFGEIGGAGASGQPRRNPAVHPASRLPGPDRRVLRAEPIPSLHPC